jgi:hypothetical protein
VTVSQDVEQREIDERTGLAVPEEPAVVETPDPLRAFGIQIPPDAPIIPATRTLDIGGQVTFTLDVAYINRAEAFYHNLFEMDVVCRAWRRNNHWEVTTEEIDWNAQMLYGEYPELVVLQRPGWAIVLHAIGRGAILTSPKLGDAEVPVSPATMRRMRARILMKSYTVVHDSPGVFSFRDPFAVVWTLVVDESLSESSS